MDIEDALEELLKVRKVLSVQLLCRPCPPPGTMQKEYRTVGPNRSADATFIIDSINALECVDAAIAILRDGQGDVINRAILRLKDRAPVLKPYEGRRLQ